MRADTNNKEVLNSCQKRYYLNILEPLEIYKHNEKNTRYIKNGWIELKKLSNSTAVNVSNVFYNFIFNV